MKNDSKTLDFKAERWKISGVPVQGCPAVGVKMWGEVVEVTGAHADELLEAFQAGRGLCCRFVGHF